jgi:hypothetical protein
MYSHNEQKLRAYASMNSVIKTYSRLDQNFTFDMIIYDRRWDQIMKVCFVFISLISYDLSLLLRFVEQILNCVFFSSPFYILCLTVASGWNKEGARSKL